MEKEFNISIETALKQATITADHYLQLAYDILRKDYEGWDVRDAIALAHIMALDFNNTVSCMKIQELRDSIKGHDERGD